MQSDDTNLNDSIHVVEYNYFHILGLFCSKCLAAPSIAADSDLCGFAQSYNDTFDWTINSRGTPSIGTGPSHIVSGNGKIILRSVLKR